MSPRNDHERQFSDLFRQAVDDVEPRPALDEIRSRIDHQETAMNPRLKYLVPLAAAAAVAAVVGGFVALQGSPGTSPDTPPLTSPTGTASPSPSDSPSPSPDATPGETQAVPVYFVGDTPSGPRLYREFVRVDVDDAAADAARAAVNGIPADSDYRTLWPEEGTAIMDVRLDGDVIRVELGSDDIFDRPAGMTQTEAALSVEQVVYTVQGTLGTRAPVQFMSGGNPVAQVLGVPTSEPLANGPILQTLAHVNLTTPTDGMAVTGDTLAVSGVANSFEANVSLQIRRGPEVVWEGFATAEGWQGEKLFPFSTSVDVSGLAPGTYVLQAMTDDPSGGAEGSGPHVDTKTIEIR